MRHVSICSCCVREMAVARDWQRSSSSRRLACKKHVIKRPAINQQMLLLHHGREQKRAREFYHRTPINRRGRTTGSRTFAPPVRSNRKRQPKKSKTREAIDCGGKGENMYGQSVCVRVSYTNTIYMTAAVHLVFSLFSRRGEQAVARTSPGIFFAALLSEFVHLVMMTNHTHRRDTQAQQAHKTEGEIKTTKQVRDAAKRVSGDSANAALLDEHNLSLAPVRRARWV